MTIADDGSVELAVVMWNMEIRDSSDWTTVELQQYVKLLITFSDTKLLLIKSS